MRIFGTVITNPKISLACGQEKRAISFTTGKPQPGFCPTG
jgi:hypothetical protein